MILSLRDLKFFLAFFLLLMLIDCSFAGFIPKAFKGDITQIKKSRRSKKISTINLSYQYPKNIRMHVKGDNTDTTYVCNPDKIWQYTPPFDPTDKKAKGNVIESTSGRYCLSKVFDFLSPGLKKNKYYNIVKENYYEYRLEFNQQVQSEIKYQQAKIFFKPLPLSLVNLNNVLAKSIDGKKTYKLNLKKRKKLKKMIGNIIDKKFATTQDMKLKKVDAYIYEIELGKKLIDELKFSQLKLIFKKRKLIFSNIDKIVLDFTKKKSPTTLKMNNIQLVSKFNPSTFVFKIPPNTEIQQMN